jgi:transcriptional regulator with XRE-family HTH domain
MSDRQPDPVTLQSAFGEQLRRLRQDQGMTLEDVSRTSGLSIGGLSQLERGKGNPAFFTLFKIAHALDVPVARLLHVERTASPVVRRGEQRELSPHMIDDEGASALMMTPDLDRSLQVVRYILPPGVSTQETPFAHAGEEFMTVLAGTLSVTVNGTAYTLRAGDSISFDSSLGHSFGNAGTETVEMIFVCTPPTF